MALSAPPCPFDYTEQNSTPHGFSFRSTPIIRSSSSATTSYSSLSEEEVVSDLICTVHFFTSLNTMFEGVVRGCQPISKVKEEVMHTHSLIFPEFGEIKIIDIKFKCQSCFHSLEDSMLECMILNVRNPPLLFYVDASSSVKQLVDNWSDTDEDIRGDDAIGHEDSGDLRTCLDRPEAITPCSICLRGLGASPLGPRETDVKEMSLEGLPKNPTQHSVSEHGDQKRKKPTRKKISSWKRNPKAKRPKRAGNSVPTFKSRA